MKIIMILTNSFDPDVRVYKEALYLVSKGVSVEIICWDRKGSDSNYPENELIDGIEITRLRIQSQAGSGMKQLPAYFKFIKSTKKYLKNKEYDYLHCHDFDGRLVGALANPRRRPIVFDMHEFYEIGSSLKRCAYRCGTMHFIKKSIAALYENDVYLGKPYGKYKNKLYSLKNYPDKKMIQCLPKEDGDMFRIGYHGAVRNQVRFFNALFVAASSFDDVRVDINGGGIDLEQLIEISKNYPRAYVHGPYNGAKESSKLYANTDVLFCGYDKAIPNHQKDAEAVKFFEAIITGTPMIMQKEIGMGEKVEREGYGISIDTDSPDEIREAIRRLKTDKEFYNNCRANELKNAPRYSWESEVQVLNQVYNF